MKDEIKEILDMLKEDLYIPMEDNREYKLLDKDNDKLLLDYITNLQEKYGKVIEAIGSILYSYDEGMYEYCDVNYIERLRELKKELGGDE